MGSSDVITEQSSGKIRSMRNMPKIKFSSNNVLTAFTLFLRKASMKISHKKCHFLSNLQPNSREDFDCPARSTVRKVKFFLFIISPVPPHLTSVSHS